MARRRWSAPARDLFLIHTDTAKWEQLTKTPVAELDAKLSPDAHMVAFRRGWDLYTVDVASGKETRLTRDGTDTLRNGIPDWVYPEELELGTGFWWSPDSKSLCYLQFDSSREPVFPHADMLGTRAFAEVERYPQAGENNPDVRLGVVAATGGPTEWVDVGDTRNAYLIARAGWMPMRARCTYPAHQSRAEPTGDGSTRRPNRAAASGFQRVRPVLGQSRRRYQFLSDGKRFLWTSERDGGFRHIYLFVRGWQEGDAVDQGQLGGDGDQCGGRDEAGGRIYYTSSEPISHRVALYTMKWTVRQAAVHRPQLYGHPSR